MHKIVWWFLDGVSKRHLNENQMMIHRPGGNNMRGSMGTSTVTVNGMRPSSGKRLFVKTNQHKQKTQENRINVNQRPFSASSLQSPYKSKVVKERRVKSGRKLKGTYWNDWQMPLWQTVHAMKKCDNFLTRYKYVHCMWLHSVNLF